MSPAFDGLPPFTRAPLIRIDTRRSPQHDGLALHLVRREDHPPRMGIRREEETPLAAGILRQVDVDGQPSRLLTAVDDDAMLGEPVVQAFVADAETECDDRSLVAGRDYGDVCPQHRPRRKPDGPDNSARRGGCQGASCFSAYGMLAEGKDRIDWPLEGTPRFMKEIDGALGGSCGVGSAAARAARPQ